ncbi:steroid monooxygenase [Fusarium sp. NRRL 52700]|nr:steroid monooxygenase [Fusarium sp. NRRL 52700]
MPGSSAREDAIKFYRNAAQNQPNPAETAAYKPVDPLAFEMSRVPMRTPRPLKIICCGAGISGLNLAHEVDTGSFANCELKIFEKNSDIGGTWFENRYPGCACDIPIHNYQFTWAPFPHFPSFYTGSQDIYEYLKAVSEQHGLGKYISLSHKIIGAKWIKERQKWQVQIVQTDGRELVVSDGQTKDGEQGEPFIEECDIFINASGAYNNWRWPTIPDREIYRGNMLHSATWPDVDYVTGKTVTLIGNGSSGIQILPAILDKADKIYVMLRSKTWVTPALANRFAGPNGANKIYTADEKDSWSKDPEGYYKYRKEIENELNARFRLYLKDSQAQQTVREITKNQMTAKLSAKPEIVPDLIPDFPVGCRRPTPGSGFLEALCSPKVEIIWGEIATFNETGLKTESGRQVDSDTIICATGFNMGFVPRFPVVGSDGRDLRQVWTKELPTAYLSVTVDKMPNYFVMMGPQSPLGHGSITGSIEKVSQYVGRLLFKLQTEAYASFVPRQAVTRAWLEHAQKWMEKTVWVEHCASSFKNGSSGTTVVSLHPGSRLHFFDLLENPRYEDFEWTSLCDDPSSMFAWLADGFTAAEASGTSDLSYYLKDAPHIKERNRSEGVSVRVNGRA